MFHIQADSSDTHHTSPTDTDTDGDGYWDGWIGVHGVDDSRDGVLYYQHLQSGGIHGDEIVNAQAGVHELSSATPPYIGADIDGDGAREHSNVHLGELYWSTDPSDTAQTPSPELTVEVDYINGTNPFEITRNGRSLIENTERNFGLYDLQIEFVESDRITYAELRNVTKYSPYGNRYVQYVTPHGFNRYELGVIESKYHDRADTLHMLWGTRIRNDYPKTQIDRRMDYDARQPTGISWTNGAPNTQYVSLIEDDFGTMIGRKAYPESDTRAYNELQSVTMHEMGHALSIGWRDDDPIPVAGFIVKHGYEAYSGDEEGRVIKPDESPEEIEVERVPMDDWSLMKAGTALDFSTSPYVRFAYSIEELSTIDFEEIPSKNE